LEIIQKIKEGPPDLVQRDLGAIRTLKGIFRELVWAETAMQAKTESFSIFLEDIESIIKKTSYQPEEFSLSAIYCADVTEARGIPFRAAAILGFAEGEFPQTLKEDPFLRDEDRKLLREVYGLPIRQSTDSAEAEYFYESVTRANSALMLTRPRIADNGAPWQPSPYWEEILRCVNLKPLIHTSRSLPDLDAASSKAEYFEIISTGSEYISAWEQAEENQPVTYRQINQALSILSSRAYDSDPSGGIYNGRLTELSAVFSERYPADHIWSASRLETYQACPYYFFVANVLALEKIEPPREGLDARQLGNIYHHILEDLYQGVGDRPELKNLQDALPEIARQVFDQAPRREGFRITSWWFHTQKEILTNLERCLVVLETLDPEFVFFRAEQKFGIPKYPEPPLQVSIRGGGFFLLRGFIDRVDKSERGTIRIIDYKTSASYGFTNKAVREGKKLQLPLYALAAQGALNLGRIQEGFYFHVRTAEPSGFKLSSFRINGKRGPSAAIENAVEISWKAIQAVRGGNFEPKAPDNGCPDYCPAMDYCWHYRPKRW
jgi:ATP-dependent helicase/DNAse subunit B